MADFNYNTGVPTPGGASYVSPQVDFSPLTQILPNYAKGEELRTQIDTRNAFRNGIPKTDSGMPDYAAMADTLAKARAPLSETLPLATQGAYQPYLDQVMKNNMATLPGAQPPAQQPASSTAAPTPYAARTAQVESGGNPGATAPTTSAKGLYGFTDPTWADVVSKHPELNLPPSVTKATPEQQKAALDAFTADNGAALTSAKIAPTDRNLRMAHLLGASGATAFLSGLSSNPNAPATSMASPAAVAANQGMFFNKDGTPVSAINFFKNATSGFADGQNAVPGAAPIQVAGAVPTPDTPSPPTAPVATQRPPQVPQTVDGISTSNITDQTLGGMVPAGTSIAQEYARNRAIEGATFPGPLAPMFKPMQDAAKAKAEAIKDAVVRWGVPTNEQKNYNQDRQPGESMSDYQARVAGQTEYTKDDVKNFATTRQKINALGEQGKIGVQQAQLGMKMVDASNFYSGPFEATNRTYKQFASAIGADPSVAMPQEALFKIANTMLQDQVKAMGQSGVGRVLQSEVNIMRNSIANLGITPMTNRLLLETVRRTYQMNSDIADLANDFNAPAGKMTPGLNKTVNSYIEAHPLFSEAEKNDPRLIAPPTFKTPEQMQGAGLPAGYPFKVQGRGDKIFWTK